jgi:hypothetical protein
MDIIFGGTKSSSGNKGKSYKTTFLLYETVTFYTYSSKISSEVYLLWKKTP